MIRVISAFAFAAALSACASDPETPAWFEARQEALEHQGTPNLHDIPRGTDANIAPQHWDAVAADLAAAEAAMKAHPRSQTPPPEPNAPAAFEDEARQDIEQTRDNY
ncbi:MAG: hypothetical protein ABW199_11845 [Caulobacterales bacterium]